MLNVNNLWELNTCVGEVLLNMVITLSALLVPEPDNLWFRVAFGPAGEVDSVP